MRRMRHLYYCVLLSMGAYGLYQAAAALSEKKTLRGEAVKRASIPGSLPAICPISILGLHSVRLFCFMCLLYRQYEDDPFYCVSKF